MIALRTELKPVFDHGLEKKQFNAGLPQCNMKLKVDFRTEQGLKRSNELELVVPSKTIPDSRPKWAKCTPVFRPNRRKNPTRWVREYPPGLPDGIKRLS